MCGRFTLTTPGEVLAEIFGLEETPALAPRYNIAPSQPVVVVRLVPEEKKRELVLLRWGLVPVAERDPARPFINARAESVAERSAFREAFARRRCLVPADGFYEWAVAEGHRQPYLFREADGRPFALAGLWEPPRDAGGQGTCTLLTTEPNELARRIHDRMPVILAREDHGRWLDPGAFDPAALHGLLRPCPADALTVHRVSTLVNNPAHDDPECLRPV